MPFPPIDGGAQVTYFNSLGLRENQADVTIIAINPSRQFVNLTSDLEDYWPKKKIIAVNVDTSISFYGIFLNFFSKHSYFTERFKSRRFTKCLIELLESKRFDIIQFEHTYMCVYIDIIREYSNAQLVLRPQNVEHIIWTRYNKGIKNPFKKFFLTYSINRLKSFESRVAKNVDAIIPLTAEDTSYFSSQALNIPVKTIPMGYFTAKLSEYNYNTQFDGIPVFYHLGSMDWLPNIEAVEWFLDFVAPIIINRVPEIKIYIAGKNMPESISIRSNKNIIIEHEIQDPVKWQENKTVMIVPLLSGSGIRAKIIEGLALGKTIISTSTGAQGISYINGHNILIADKPAEFADLMHQCYHSIDQCRSIGSNAKILSNANYDYLSTSKMMLETYSQLINKRTEIIEQ